MPIRLALYQPDIAQNTGTMLRLAACLGVGVDVIGPAGFDLSDRALKRAGLDYLQHVEIVRHLSFAAFMAAPVGTSPAPGPSPQGGGEPEPRKRAGRLVLLTTRAETAYTDFAFAGTDTLMVGRESVGVPDAVHAAVDARLRIPMRPGLRSLNVAVAAAMVLGEALRQTGWKPDSHV